MVGITALGLTSQEIKMIDANKRENSGRLKLREFGESTYFFRSGVSQMLIEISPN